MSFQKNENKIIQACLDGYVRLHKSNPLTPKKSVVVLEGTETTYKLTVLGEQKFKDMDTLCRFYDIDVSL